MEALLFQTSPVSSTHDQGDLEPVLFPTVLFKAIQARSLRSVHLAILSQATLSLRPLWVYVRLVIQALPFLH